VSARAVQKHLKFAGAGRGGEKTPEKERKSGGRVENPL
jgi:hypothetical protein